MWKKIIIITAVLFLTTLVLFIYNEFNGNPLSKYIAKQALATYLEETYPDNDFVTDQGHYDFKFNEYYFVVTPIGRGPVVAEESGAKGSVPDVEKYSFTVRGFLRPNVSMDGIRMSRLDEKLMERLSKEANMEILDLLQTKIEHVHSVETTMEVLIGQFSSDVSWDKALPLDQPISIYVATKAGVQTVEEFYEDVKTIQSLLNDSGYNYDRVSINGKVIDKSLPQKDDGYVKYAAGFGPMEQIDISDITEF